ncbi:protein NLRC5 [Narcine bancroftii]|uniref:protein NLRC5 n=1 Tax=Narcine bancroftii TaxID=1343680 RepID=UPI0038321038
MSSSGITDVLEDNHGLLVESLSQHANCVIEKAKTILTREEQKVVDSRGTDREKISMLLKRLITKDNDTCRNFFEMLIITLPCDVFPLCLENSLMAAGKDNVQITLREGRKRSIGQVERSHPSGVKKAKKGNYCKAAALKSSSGAKLSQTVLNLDHEEMDRTPHQSEEYMNLPTISDSAEDYKALMMKTISQQCEASGTKEEKMKQVTIAQTFRSLSMKDGNVAKLKERIDASRDDVFNSHGVEEDDEITTANIAEFLNKNHDSNCKINILLGKAGTGKTKLMHQICYEWARGAVDQFLYVFLFEFRQLNLINKKIDLKTMLFDLFLKPERNAHTVFRFIEENPQKVLILFDGFDEFAGKASISSLDVSSNPNAQISVGQLFSSLFHGKMLPGCTILITSRPKDIFCLPLDVVSYVGEVSGFNQHKIEEYAHNFFKDTERSRKAISHLQKNREILNMCYIPALCWIVFLCLDHLLSQSCTEPKLPHSVTQFYIKMLTVFLSKGAHGHGQIENLLLNEYREEIHGLCNLAVRGLKESKSVFYLKDLLCEKVTMFASSFGFLSTFEVKTIDHNQETGYAFVHLTLQEFLAALHQMINNQITHEMLKNRFCLKSKWTYRSDMKNEYTNAVHIFLSGLSSSRCKHFLSSLANHNRFWVQRKQKAILLNLQKLASTNLTGPKIIELCYCVYETQKCDLAREVAAQLKNKFELRNFRLTPADMTVLTFIINSGTCNASMHIGGCALDLECIRVLGTCKKLEMLVFKSRRYEDKFAQTLSAVIPKVNNLKKLILASCSIGAKGAGLLSSALGICQHLEEISLYDNELGDAGIEMVTCVLPQIANLRKVELGSNNSTIEGVLSIANVLRTCSNTLDIQVCDGGNVASIRFLSNSAVIPMERSSLSPMKSDGSPETVQRKLSVVRCKLTEQHVQSLSQILQHGCHLAWLDLSDNKLEDHGLRRLVEFLPEFHISKSINLSNNGFSENGVLCLVKVLRKYSNVLEIKASLKCRQRVLIKFSEHRGGPDGRDDATTQMMNNSLRSTQDSKAKTTLLRKLSLTNCCFQLKHLVELMYTLEHCSDLAELDLSDNSLGDRGFSKLVELLPKLHVGRLVNVSNNLITMTGVFCLIKCLNKMKTVTEVAISLGKNGKGLIFYEDQRFQKERGLQEKLEHKCGRQSLCLPRKISLEECEIDDETMRQLCLILKTSSALTKLDLSNNTLSEKAITVLLYHLRCLQHLETLSITDNSISSDTALLLAESLNICENVQEVEVRSSGRATINFMKKCCRCEGNKKQAARPHSRILSLRECNLRTMNLEQLFKILEHCKNLAEVDLSCNLLDDEGFQSLRNILPKLQVLNLLDVSNNSISPTGVLYLVESLNTCRNLVEVEVSLASNGRTLLKFARRCKKKVCSVKECNLKGKDLLKFFSIIEQCTHLTELKFTSNIMETEHLRNLVEIMGNLKHLKQLHLQKNGISLTAVENLFVALKRCPKTLTVSFEEHWIHGANAANLVKCIQTHLNAAEIRIKKMQALVRLMESGKRNSVSTSAVSYPSLRIISLQQCGIEAPHLVDLLSIIKQHPNLKELHLCQNNLGDKGAEILAEILQVVRALRNLSLDATNIGNAGMVTVIGGICRCHSLEELNLSHNELGVESARELGNILPGLKQLRIIKMASTVGLTETNNLARGLSYCTSLEEINLDSLLLKDSGTQLLAEGIPRMTCLKKLNLKLNSIGCKGAAELATGLKGSTGMVEINLGDNSLEDVGALKLADVLSVMKSLKILKLTRNNITAVGGQELVEALRHCPSVEEVDLSRNSIGNEAAEKLAKALPKMPCLKILNLHSCGLDTDGGLSLAQVFMYCPTLMELSLSENNIGTAGIMELGLALRSLKSLKKLSLKLNSIDNSMAANLADGLVCCPAMEEVVLSWNNISDEGAVRLAEVLPRMRCLRKLDLEGNKIKSAGAEKLANSLRQCSSIEVIRLWKNNIPNDRAQNLQEQDSRLNFFSVYSSAL